jgi:hypothetical protein
MKSMEFIIQYSADALADLRKISQISAALSLNEMRSQTNLEKQFYNTLPKSDSDDRSLRTGNTYWPMVIWINENSKSIYLITVIDQVEFIDQQHGYSYFKYSRTDAQVKFPTEDILLNEEQFYYHQKKSIEQAVMMLQLNFGDWNRDMRAYDISGNLRPLTFSV